jgi:hypothetical protein
MRTRGSFFAVLIPLSFSLAACVAPTTGDDEAVESAAQSIKGAAEASAYPEAVLIDTIQDGQATPFCSGALIAPRVVLTAARCASDYNRLRIRAPFAYGEEAWSRWATVYDFTSSESLRGEVHDVGLIFLDHPIYLNAYPQLASWPLGDGDQVVSVGRVRDGENAGATAYVSEPVSVVSAASHGYRHDYAVAPLTEYADYGGPVFLPRSHTIVAVNAGIADGASLLARVDDVSGWIRQQVQRYESGGGNGWPGGPGYPPGGWPGGPGYPPGGWPGGPGGGGHGDGDGHGHGPGWPPPGGGPGGGGPGGGGHGDGDGHGNGPGWPPPGGGPGGGGPGGGGHGDGDGHGHGPGWPPPGGGPGGNGPGWPPGGGPGGNGPGWPPPGGGGGGGHGDGHGGGGQGNGGGQGGGGDHHHH